MSYKINFSDNINKESITINDNLINSDTSLGFPGRNQKGYAITIAENFLHLLENFAKTSPPSNPIEGQIWYDSSAGNQTLKVYNGTAWSPAGSLNKGIAAPTNNIQGDLWVDTKTNQLKLYTGGGWILVGPTFSSSLRTGAFAEPVLDQSNSQLEHTVLKNYANDIVVSIVSSEEFTPLSVISGFTTIKKGINLNSNLNKFWGTSEKSENLIVGGSVVPALNFLRKDTPNITDYGFSVRNDTGLYVGNTAQLKLTVEENRGILCHKTPGSRLDFKVNVGSASANETTLLSLDSTYSSVLVGVGNSYTGATLSVEGSGRFTGQLSITRDTQSTNTSTGSLLVAGGAVVSKTLRVGGELYVDDQMYTRGIIPKVTNVSDLGSSSLRFATVYATTINATSFSGSLTGSVTGSVSGTASRLVSSTTFKIQGDVEDATGIAFDGPTLDQSAKVFTTTISTEFITNKPVVDTTIDSDEILIYRSRIPGSGTPAGIKKTTKQALLKNLGFVPVGSIFPFAGPTKPPGYVFCDGSEKSVGTYQELFNIIGYTYTMADRSKLVGGNTFQVPDLRGRFPLGLYNMDNEDYVANPDPIPLDVRSNTATMNPTKRVNDSTANNIGQGAGDQQITISASQLPQHSHKLVGDNNGQFYAINDKSTDPIDSGAISGIGLTESSQSQFLPNTGGINQSTTGQPINIMNPYLAINYIIYTGVFE